VSLPEGRSAQAQSPKDNRVASTVPSRASTTPASVLDWTLLGSATNLTLKGDTTYYVSGLVTLSASGSNG